MDKGVLIAILIVICVFIVGVFAFSGNDKDVNNNLTDNGTDLNLSSDDDGVTNYGNFSNDNKINSNSKTNNISHSSTKTQNQTGSIKKNASNTNDNRYSNKQKQEPSNDDIPRCISCGAPVQTYGIKCSNCAAKDSGKSYSSKSSSNSKNSDSKSSTSSQSSSNSQDSKSTN